MGNTKLVCECCGQNLYRFVGGYSDHLRYIYFDDVMEDIRPYNIDTRVKGIHKWFYLLAEYPDSHHIGDPGISKTTVANYWYYRLLGLSSQDVKKELSSYWDLTGYNQGDEVTIGFVGGDSWLKKRLPHLTKEYLNNIFFDPPIDARVVGPGCEFMFNTVDDYRWDKEKAIRSLVREHPHLENWARKNLPEQLTYN